MQEEILLKEIQCSFTENKLVFPNFMTDLKSQSYLKQELFCRMNHTPKKSPSKNKATTSC